MLWIPGCRVLQRFDVVMGGSNIPAPGRRIQLLDGIGHELDLRAHDDLGIFSAIDEDTGDAAFQDFIPVDDGSVSDLYPQPGSAMVDGEEVLGPPQPFIDQSGPLIVRAGVWFIRH